MPSIEELRACIVRLDGEIELQKKLLRKLEKDKILAHRQLNAALDPVARLPFEISSEILLRSHAARRVPSALLQICNAWTEIVLDTPALWTTICIHFPCGDDFAELLRIWFQRARNRPVSIAISLNGRCGSWNHHISDVVWRHSGLFEHLEILDDDDLARDDESLDLFGDITSVSLPLLQTLTIRCQHEQRIYRASQILQLLRGAPNIVEFISHKVWTRDNPSPETLVVPTLRRVIFGETSNGDDEVFLHLVLPALETLSLPMRYVSSDEFVARIERSAAPLQDLALGWKLGVMGAVQLHNCLRLIPTLIRFKMWLPHSEVVTELFTALAESPSLLPNLRDLTIDIYTGDLPHIPDSSWRTLVRALSTRRMERLWIIPVPVSPPTDVLASLRELAAAGTKMHVGTEKLNFVVA
ncbi:hypothetical protein MSAN_00435500 [Mycena sanguinolenta]|uniref:F-box domain-containing protein n=1 Tax=Mycena sanguinolenta TaxID=230812 RepID=A0A8H7DIF1_9AGAR|nr:hypothetical protein MSAN_00435500 [Mycena sanguinolenta]